MKKRTLGIILLVVGAMALFGSIANGTFAGYANGVSLADITAIGVTAALIIIGIVLILKKQA